MGYQKFNIIFFSTLLAALCICGIINYVLDPYTIFHEDFRDLTREPNGHFIKMKYLVKNPSRYDSFLFGSSRVGHIDTEKIPGGRFYNVYYSEGLPAEFLSNINILLDSGVPVKNVLIGLDEFSYKIDPESHNDTGLRQPYGTTMQNFRFYCRYLFHLPSTAALKDRLKGSPIGIVYDFHKTGLPLHMQVDEKIEKDRESHTGAQGFQIPLLHYEGNRIAQTIADIEKIKHLCDSRGIKLILFINPIHKTALLHSDLSQFEEFKRKLASVSGFFDFSGCNSITTDNYYYYETTHYRYLVGDLMIQRMFDRDAAAVPSDFGIFVTKTDIEEHLKNLRAKIDSECCS